MDHNIQRTIGPYILSQTLGKGQTGIYFVLLHILIPKGSLNTRILESCSSVLALICFDQNDNV